MNNSLKNIILTPMNLLYKINPTFELKLLYRLKMGHSLDLKSPKNYNEKIQWIKLYDRNPQMPICVDKFTVRQFVNDRGCGVLLNDLLWEGFDAKDIPFDDLPNKFVIKTTHGSGNNIIVKDKDKVNKSAIIRKMNRWLKEKFLPCYGEWFYGVIRPRIIVEKYLEGDNGENLFDYKIFCFNGEPKLVYVDTWYGGSHSINAYDIDFNLLPDIQLGHRNDTETKIEKPVKFEEMLSYAKKLSTGFRHVRVDFYIDEDKVIFGEMTFTKSAGYGKIVPESFNVTMGSWINISDINKKDELSV